jgi:hypothetical protein
MTEQIFGKTEKEEMDFCFISFSEYLPKRHNVLRQHDSIIKTSEVKEVETKFCKINKAIGGGYSVRNLRDERLRGWQIHNKLPLVFKHNCPLTTHSLTHPGLSAKIF